MAKAKKEVRSIVASADVGGYVDRGASVDGQLKAYQDEDKIIKGKIGDAAKFIEGETSIRLVGQKAQALVSKKVAYEIDFEGDAAGKTVFEKNYEDGVFNGSVKRVIGVTLPCSISAAVIEESVRTLGGSVEVSYKAKGSMDDLAKDVKERLSKVLVKTESLSVKYEPKEV